ncbi:YlbF family regulator [Desulfofalx alkaliphila]|uniref:YlbF family regulator n=1 Tax=Desulfofalx alkaliphila TaxID=105483 RepID=UPI00068C1DBF|nr:YlbF family regulator [Desulfofalx alkaliphila]
MMEKLEAKAKELGELITHTEEYKAVKQKQAAMMEDEESMGLLMNFQKLQKENYAKRQNNTLTEEDIKAVEQAELSMLENDKIRELHEAQTAFQSLLNAVMKEIVAASR